METGKPEMEFMRVDGTHARLEDILRAEAYVESLHDLRVRLAHAIVIPGCFIWVVASYPGVLPAWLSKPAEALWPLLLGALAVLLFLESRARAEMNRLIHDGADESPVSPAEKD